MEHAPLAPVLAQSNEGYGLDQKDVVEPEFVAVVTNLGKHAKIHPTVATPGEVLPEGYARSLTGFLICNKILEVKVDQEIVAKETIRLQRHTVVAYFVGGRQQQAILNQWISAISAEIGEWVGLGRDLGQGFF